VTTLYKEKITYKKKRSRIVQQQKKFKGKLNFSLKLISPIAQMSHHSEKAPNRVSNKKAVHFSTKLTAQEL